METILLQWKPTPEDENKSIAYNLINHINFSFQRIVADMKQMTEILYYSKQSAEEILKNMGSDGKYWYEAYNQYVTFVNNLSALVGKRSTDVAPKEVIETTKDIIVDSKTGEITTKSSTVDPKSGEVKIG